MNKDIGELVETWSEKPLVKALQALRGVQLLTAVILVAEIGDFRRFATAPALMAYLGLVPSEYSSGDAQHRGRITRAGNRHVRTTLIEAAWNNRFRPNVSRDLAKRQEGISPNVTAIATKAQHRLYSRYKKLTGRGKDPKKTVTAMARELAGFVWAVARETTIAASTHEALPRSSTTSTTRELHSSPGATLNVARAPRGVARKVGKEATPLRRKAVA